MQPVSIIAMLGIGVATLPISLLLCSPFGDRRANRILAVFLAVLSLFLVQHTISVEGLAYHYPHLQGLTLWLYFLLGPLLYCYTYTLTMKNKEGFKLYPHLLPTVLIFLVYLPALLQPAEAKRAFVASYGGTPRGLAFSGTESAPELDLIFMTVAILYFLFALQLLSYALLSLRLLRRHHRAIYNNFSDLDRLRLRWLSALSTLVLIAACLIMFSYVLSTGFPDLHFSHQELPSTILVTCLIYFVGFNGLSQPATYAQIHPVPQSEPILSTSAITSQKYEKSGLSAELRSGLWQTTQLYMKQHKPFIQQGLTIGRLAGLVDTTEAYLSQAINGESGANFHDYINQYRIEEAKQLLEKNQGLRMPVKLYLQVGYRSKSNFYTQFKKHCNDQTPKQYREALLN